MFLREFVRRKHKTVCYDSPNCAWDESSPETSVALLTVYRFSAVYDSTIWNIPLELGELGLLCDL